MKNETIHMLGEDMGETLTALSEDRPYYSTTWRIFEDKETPNKRYSLNRPEELLEAIKNNRVKMAIMHYSLGPLEEAYNNPEIAKHLEGKTVFNLYDFIYACCYDKAILTRWLPTIAKALILSVNKSTNDTEEQAALTRVLYRIHAAINPNNHPNKQVH